MQFTYIFYTFLLVILAVCFSGGVRLVSKKTFENRDRKGRYTKSKKTLKRGIVKIPRKIRVTAFGKPDTFITVYDTKVINY